MSAYHLVLGALFALAAIGYWRSRGLLGDRDAMPMLLLCMIVAVGFMGLLS